MTNNKIIKKYANVLVQYSLQLKENDKLLINATYLAEELVNEIYSQALEVGALPELKIGLKGTSKIFYDKASEIQLEYVSPVSRYIYENYDAVANIISPFNVKELQNVPAEKKQKASSARADLNKIFMQRAAAKKLRWTLCVEPTDAEAQECGMSLDEYRKFVYNCCFLYEEDPIACWQRLHDSQQRIVDFLNTKENIQYIGKNLDVSFNCAGRKWINSSGKNNMPSGEVFTTPVENSINGKVRFSYPGIYMGQEIEDIALEIKDGKVIKASAAKGQELLDKILAIPGADHFGEAAIGNNIRVNKFTKNMLFDEKMAGTIHMALGASYPETGGVNESAIHWDLLADINDGQILADGQVIYKNGKFTI